MFGSSIHATGAHAQREAVVTANRVTTWRRLSELADSLEKRLEPLEGRRVALRFLPVAESFAALAALDRLHADVFLLDGLLDPQEVRSLATELQLAAIVNPVSGIEGANDSELLDREAPGTGNSTVTILTSGTTGRPKAARHTWESLSRPVRTSDTEAPQRWLLSYRPQLYAGLQVVLQTFVNHGTLIVPPADATPDAIAELMCSARAEYASATPSYWGRLMLFAARDVLKRIPLKQVTLGGEVVDQQILDALKACFPGARLVHIYATTELGRCFSVTDGFAGFPKGFLEQTSADGVQLQIDEGELLVRSANRMQGYDRLACDTSQAGEWFATGDLVEIVGERVYFMGRGSDMINVGGNKVHPLEVEQVIRQVPGISDVRVYAKSSSIAGQLVACDLVIAPGTDQATVRETVVAHCVARLSEAQRPRLFRVVDQVELAQSGKKIRRAVS